MTYPDIVVAAVVLMFAALFAAASLTSGPFAAKSRIAIVTGGLEAVLALALGWALAPWSIVGAGWWLVPVALVAAGAAGAVMRWSELPWRRPRKSTSPADSGTTGVQAAPAVRPEN